MRVLIVNNGLTGGGAEKLINDMLPIINKTEYGELLILSDKDEKYLENLQSQGVHVEVVPQRYRGHWQTIKYIKNYIKKGKYDIIHANCFPTFYYCALIKKIWKRDCPYLIMTEHNTDNRRRHVRLFRPLEKYIYSAYDRIVSISDATQEALIRWLSPQKTDKFVVIENGVPIEAFKNAYPLSRKELYSQWKEDDFILCMVGSFSEQKNHRLMLEIMEKLPGKYHLILLGEGKLKEEIETVAQDKELSDRVHFLGFRKDVANVIKTSDVVVIPSKWEGFGLIAVEAMAAGKPVVCADVPGLSEVVGECAIKIQGENVMDYISGIQSLENMEDYQKYCNDSLQQSQKYSIVDMVNKYIAFYKQGI